jgi:hypothetical protein
VQQNKKRRRPWEGDVTYEVDVQAEILAQEGKRKRNLKTF